MSWDPFDPWEALGGSGGATDWGLGARQRRAYYLRAILYRTRYAYDASGAETKTYAPVAVNVPFYLEASPSQFEMQGEVLQAEGDNVFTLDKTHWPAAADPGPEDYFQITAVLRSVPGAARILNGWWRMRGDIQPHVYRANKVIVIASRIPEPPAGLSA